VGLYFFQKGHKENLACPQSIFFILLFISQKEHNVTDCPSADPNPITGIHWGFPGTPETSMVFTFWLFKKKFDPFFVAIHLYLYRVTCCPNRRGEILIAYNIKIH